MACTVKVRVCFSGDKNLSTGNLIHICVGNAIRNWDSNNSLCQRSHVSAVSCPRQCQHVTCLDKSKKSRTNILFYPVFGTFNVFSSFLCNFCTQSHRMLSIYIFRASEHLRKNLGAAPSSVHRVWDEFQIQTIVVAFTIENHTPMPFLGHFSKEKWF